MFDLFIYVCSILVLDSNHGQVVTRGQHKERRALDGVHRAPGVASSLVAKRVKSLFSIDTLPGAPE